MVPDCFLFHFLNMDMYIYIYYIDIILDILILTWKVCFLAFGLVKHCLYNMEQCYHGVPQHCLIQRYIIVCVYIYIYRYNI